MYMLLCPGVKASYFLILISILVLVWMPPDPLCSSCGHKWVIVGGGLCQVCRTVDRLAAICRSGEVPASAEHLVLQRLRQWWLSCRTWGSCAAEWLLAPCRVVRQHLLRLRWWKLGPLPNTHQHLAPVPAGGSSVALGATEPGSRGVEERSPSKGGAASSSKPAAKDKKKKKTRDKPKSFEASRKRSRRSRSSRSRHQDSRALLASPVRPAGVKSEGSDSQERADRRERKARPRSPSRRPVRRSPPGPPPRRAEPTGVVGRDHLRDKGKQARRRGIAELIITLGGLNTEGGAADASTSSETGSCFSRLGEGAGCEEAFQEGGRRGAC